MNSIIGNPEWLSCYRPKKSVKDGPVIPVKMAFRGELFSKYFEFSYSSTQYLYLSRTRGRSGDCVWKIVLELHRRFREFDARTGDRSDWMGNKRLLQELHVGRGDGNCNDNCSQWNGDYDSWSKNIASRLATRWTSDCPDELSAHLEQYFEKEVRRLECMVREESVEILLFGQDTLFFEDSIEEAIEQGNEK